MGDERNIRCVLEYDGTRFAGWQIQPDCRTVQGVVEEGLEHILGHTVRITAAGRTDAGVHATGQVVNFATSSDFPIERMVRALNGVLPRDVSALTATVADRSFNARFGAIARTYRYTITDRRISVGRRYAWHVKYRLDRELLAGSTRPLSGHCDLRGFSRGGDDDDYSTIVHSEAWSFEENRAIFEICAVRFFHHAVRSIVGTAVEAARGRIAPDSFERILADRDRSLAGPTAPALGLCLVHIDYGDES